MSRCWQGWRYLPRSRPTLLMTKSNWEVEGRAVPSLVNSYLGKHLILSFYGLAPEGRPGERRPGAITGGFDRSHPKTGGLSVIPLTGPKIEPERRPWTSCLRVFDGPIQISCSDDSPRANPTMDGDR
jgi:hypothetical protein